ncbi:MAG TPA: PhnD/SsuA/transferrin family substrate-binding protein, partial [bacterium]
MLALALLTMAVSVFAKPFVFTAIPDDDQTRLVKRFGAVADYLSKKLNADIKYVPVKTYEASVTAFKNNQMQMAWFGGLSGVQARLAVPGSKAIVQGEEDKEFVTYFIANSSTALSEGKALPDAVKGMTFTFGAKTSTSGRLMSDYFIRERFKKS